MSVLRTLQLRLELGRTFSLHTWGEQPWLAVVTTWIRAAEVHPVTNSWDSYFRNHCWGMQNPPHKSSLQPFSYQPALSACSTAHRSQRQSSKSVLPIQIHSLTGYNRQLIAICNSPRTCLSVKWYWQSFFHSSRSSLSTCRSGATWPRLTRSLPSLSRCMMFNCKQSGRSVKVVPLKAGWEKK